MDMDDSEVAVIYITAKTIAYTIFILLILQLPNAQEAKPLSSQEVHTPQDAQANERHRSAQSDHRRHNAPQGD